MALDVKVKIDLKKPVGKAGFGYPLIMSYKSTGTAVSYTECKSLNDFVTAGATVGSDDYKVAAAMFSQDNAPEKIAYAVFVGNDASTGAVTSLATIINKGWRQLVTVGMNTAASAISEYIESTNKLYFVGVDDDILEESAALITATQDRDRTVLVYAKTGYDALAGAVVGATAGLDAGSFTYKNIIVKGQTPTDDDGILTSLDTLNVMTVTTKAGDIVTSEGKARSGEYIDIIDSRDYIIQSLEYKTQKVLNNTKKVPYDNNGIAMLESVAIDVMQDAYNKGMIAVDDDGAPAYTVSYALRSQTSESDIAARKYVGGYFSFTLAGAIHKAEITGEIIV
jgi:hypothetical protein